ncbi:MAG: HAMP domain-containing sensor histidine kinase [Caldisericia bacterium]|jgi:signal transduction histidine kinase|nr:HAMP domain-containing sensor histidine kinase [Caldisericia bacterium]
MKIRWKIIILSIIIVLIVLIFIIFFLNYQIPQHFDEALRKHGPPLPNQRGQMRVDFLNRIRTSLIFSGLIAIGISIILSFIFSKYIEKPIIDLKEGVKRVANSDFNFSIRRESDDEIGELVDDFNYMVKKLKNLEEIRKDLVSKIIHEISTPLTGISGIIEAIEDKVIPEEEVPKEIKTIKEEIERLTKMIEDLRNYSYIESINFKLNFENINLKEEIEYVIEILKNKYKNKNIKLITELYPIMIKGDKKRIKEIFINILDNAFKFSKENGTIYIKSYNDKNYAYVLIKDEGIGIDREDLNKIFTKFYRGKNAEINKIKGVGLGLLITKELVEAHKGKIEIKSEKDKGTEVIVSFLMTQ